MLVGVRNPPVVLFLKGVFRRIGIGIAPLPELLDELLPFFVGRKVQESVLFFRGDDVDDVFVQPLFILGIELAFQASLTLFLLFCGLFRRLAAGLVVVFLLRSSCEGNAGERQRAD